MTRADRPHGSIVTRFAAIEPTPIDWVWPAHLPAGMLTVLDGDPGLGKSTLVLDLAARVSRGAPMPDASGGGDPAGVVLLSAEDDLARTIRPRLDAAGADVERVATIELPDGDGLRRPPLITPHDLGEVEVAVGDLGARLCVLDPLVAYLPDAVDTNRDHSVRRALAALSALGERTGCAIVVVRHLRKSCADNPLYRGGGSIGITAAARAAFLLALDPGDAEGRRRVLAPLKMNLALLPASRALHLAADLGQQPRIVWEGVSPLSAADLLAQPAEGEDRGALGEAKDVLCQILADGPVSATDGQAQARRAGLKDRTLDRARHALGVQAIKTGRPGELDQEWTWSLPPKDASQSRRAPSSNGGVLRPAVAPFDAEGRPNGVEHAWLAWERRRSTDA